MDMTETSKEKKAFKVFLKAVLMVGVLVGFYKLPSIIAEKISYIQLKNTEIKQNLSEDE